MSSETRPLADTALAEARYRLSLVEGCMDCRADDERLWRFIIDFLQEKPEWSIPHPANGADQSCTATATEQPSPDEALIAELLERARDYINIATRCGQRTDSPHNHVVIMEELVAAITAIPSRGEGD